MGSSGKRQKSGSREAEVLAKAAGGGRLSREEGIALFAAKRGQNYFSLTALGMAANACCARLHPGPYRTYIIDRNINYSNVCTSRCKFCAFWRESITKDAYVVTEKELFEKIEEALALGGTQILLQGGLHPGLGADYFEKLFRAVKSRFRIHLHALSPPEIVHVARLSHLSVEQVIRRLQAAGLDTIPGGGAEILVDEVRRQVSPRKCSTAEWLDVMRTAHRLGMRTTATMMFGHVETVADRIEHLLRIRELQDETGGFTAFIPWTFQPKNTQLRCEPVGGFEYLKTLAISRLMLDNVPNIQASWVTQGAKIGQLALAFGANDMGSIMIEENVVRAAGCSFRMTTDEIRRLIADAGFEPRQRDCYYRLVR
jgi:cyclic dehypoxanthinyl futalosine synthase